MAGEWVEEDEGSAESGADSSGVESVNDIEDVGDSRFEVENGRTCPCRLGTLEDCCSFLFCCSTALNFAEASLNLEASTFPPIFPPVPEFEWEFVAVVPPPEPPNPSTLPSSLFEVTPESLLLIRRGDQPLVEEESMESVVTTGLGGAREEDCRDGSTSESAMACG